MYKYLLCWRYLRTRWIALASIISVTLGVATMIIVNSVMAGFSHEMLDRLHSILSDVVFEAHSLEGFPDPNWHMDQIRRIAGDDIAGMTPTVHVPGMLAFDYGGRWVTRQVQVIGVDPATVNEGGDVTQYLQYAANRRRLSFELPDGGFERPGAPGEPAKAVPGGWDHRRRVVQMRRSMMPPVVVPPAADGADNPTADRAIPQDPLAGHGSPVKVFDPSKEQHPGLVLGIALANYRDAAGDERFLVLPGDDVKVTIPTAGTPPRAVDFTFTVVDLWESKMSEYDTTLVFVPIDRLQELRGMLEPQSGVRFVSAIQIRLKPGANLDAVRDKLQRAFAPELYNVSTWRDKQGPLLAAVQMETAILNLLLFMIIAVAGFGILAIFFMIVVEKTRDIGILKSLGASRCGVMGVFLGYGLALGIVGGGAGLILGLAMVANINNIADWLGRITGRPLFNPEIYYFYKIPTIVEVGTVSWIVFGALMIAVLSSVLPALRAATLHPVRALRYE